MRSSKRLIGSMVLKRGLKYIDYSNVNIKNTSLLEALKSPLFMQYRANQPFNHNLLRPCPLLDNPEKLRKKEAT